MIGKPYIIICIDCSRDRPHFYKGRCRECYKAYINDIPPEVAMNRPFPWKCRECRERAVSPATVDYVTELEHDGRLYPVTVNDLTVLRCEKCGSMQLPDASHERLMVALRRAAGLLTPNQITTRRSALGLNQKAFAQLLGVAPATVCRWESGGQIQQRVMNDFITAFFEVPELRAYLSKAGGPCQ